MDDEDWLEILRHIQAELREIGLQSLAELSGYAEETHEARRSFGARKLTILMLDALDRHLAIHSSDTVDRALNIIRENSDSERLDGAILINDRDDIDVEGREHEEMLRGDPRIPSAMKDLRNLIGQLLEADSSGGADGEDFE
ncbi:hypothetical protein SAMN04488041_11219 [Sulfitobacter pontiacus]|uniref:Uncharacterized protein n=1 Tax=Sulfitobacter pontiacus TaxID=60137 RepID=A0A1H3DU61_9RHOB|nr:hypothetical protein [Sulfitobacter pontiacus]SDX69204.1 hypothetical protein SAMN04488041_11219 [Sulfitobacter pontiacus]|tara:strand:- start:6200 stop:6625 length:426 start_codon:yes stop_codon:yes gene_type:complete